MKIKHRWMVKEPNKPVEEREFEINFKNLDDRSNKELKLVQGLVGGYVEVAWIGGDVKVLINEEAMFGDFKPNCGFLGTIIFFKEVMGDDDEAWWGSLTDEEVKKVKAWTIVHGNDIHMKGPIQVLAGEAIEKYRDELRQNAKRRQEEWNSF